MVDALFEVLDSLSRVPERVRNEGEAEDLSGVKALERRSLSGDLLLAKLMVEHGESIRRIPGIDPGFLDKIEANNESYLNLKRELRRVNINQLELLINWTKASGVQDPEAIKRIADAEAEIVRLKGLSDKELLVLE